MFFPIFEKSTFFQCNGRRKQNYLRKFPVSLLEIFDQAELGVYTE